DPGQLSARAVKTETSKKTMEELQTGDFPRQIVPGHEHKGSTFYSKPSCIHFKDFDVGQTYKKKLVLTNASYSSNYCRLVGVSEWLKDFITVHFSPPGKMSPGMSCEVMVTFKPAINESLEGAVLFLALTGAFSVPLKCTVKSCILALDKELIDFGSHVVGETISQTITLTNRGALGTRFKVQTSAGDRSTHRATVKSAPGRMVGSKPFPKGTEMLCCVKCGGTVQSQVGRSLGNQLGQPLVHLDTDNADDSVEPSSEETPAEIMLGKVTEGEIGPFSSIKLPVVFAPAVPGDSWAEFVITFDSPDCKPVS
ncbi:Uncharacterized protein KIAA1751, partial [Acanthisitta chloris]